MDVCGSALPKGCRGVNDECDDVNEEGCPFTLFLLYMLCQA